jgi:transcriptional regulator with XRE-family HTH domain
MTQNPEARPVQTVAERVKEVRTRRGLSAARLAERLRSVGLEWDRSVVANLENGRRASIDVAELLALAAVLDVAPVHLLVPTDEGDYQATPTITVDTVTARAWVRGFQGLPGSDPRDFEAEVPLSELPRIQPVGPRRRFEQTLRSWLQRVLVHPSRDATVHWAFEGPGAVIPWTPAGQEDSDDG